MPKNFSQKGFTANLLQFMKDLEKNKLCCLDFLTQVYTSNAGGVIFSGNGTQSNPLTATVSGAGGDVITTDSSTIHFTGLGTISSPLIGSAKISATAGNSLIAESDGLFIPGFDTSSTILESATAETLNTTIKNWVFTGTTPQTWLAPTVAGNTGKMLFIKNRGTAILTVNAQGSDDFYLSSPITTFTLVPGDSTILVIDNAYINIE